MLTRSPPSAAVPRQLLYRTPAPSCRLPDRGLEDGSLFFSNKTQISGLQSHGNMARVCTLYDVLICWFICPVGIPALHCEDFIFMACCADVAGDDNCYLSDAIGFHLI
jgi:hypothetical protein